MRHRLRAEDEWWEPAKPSVGSATGASGQPSDTSDFIANLWVPDPEARRGWREVYVERPKPGVRPLGFRR